MKSRSLKRTNLNGQSGYQTSQPSIFCGHRAKKIKCVPRNKSNTQRSLRILWRAHGVGKFESLPDELVQLILLEATIAYHQPLPRHNKGPEIAQSFEAPHWRTRTELLHSLPAVWFVVDWRDLLPPSEFIRGEIYNDEWSRDKEQGSRRYGSNGGFRAAFG